MKHYTNIKQVGNRFFVRGYENGNPFEEKDHYSPTTFVKVNKKSKFRTLNGEYAKPIKHGSIKECKEFYDTYDSISNYSIFGNERFLYPYISDNYPGKIEYDFNSLKIAILDIEVASEEGFPDVESSSEEILSISVQDYISKSIITWGVKPFKMHQNNLEYFECSSETHLLRSFLHYWTNNYPDIVTGWNIKLYDIPYISRRLEKILGESELKSLSPWNYVRESEVYIIGKRLPIMEISGISQLDYLDLYKKFTYKIQESYRLDYIAEVELNQKKLDHSEFETFKDFYTNGWQKFIEYNIVDVELIGYLEDKMKLIDLAVTMAYDAKVNFEDVFSQVRMWDSIIFNHLKEKKIVIPPNRTSQKNSKYAGAYVKEPVPGMYDYVVSFDLNSLYPHLIIQYNISPETLFEDRLSSINVNKILNKEIDLSQYSDYAVCANGAMYKKDKQGFLPELMEKIYNERVIYKRKMLEAEQQYEKTPTKELEKQISKYNNFQMARKIQLNSAYGAIGNQYFRYFKVVNAEAITLSGQVSIQWIMNKINLYLNKILKTNDNDYVIASDTDSLYINMGDLVNHVFKNKEKDPLKIVNFLDTICKEKIEPYIEKSYQELADYVNAYAQKMHMKRECIADRGIWTAKKRYILNVWDSEGVRYEKPKLKIKGLEAIKSSVPNVCRKLIKEAINILLTKEESDIIDFIENTRNNFHKYSPEEISFPRSVSDLGKYYSYSEIYTKGTPIHVRGALLFNYHLKENKLMNKYSEIKDGEKIKFCYLKMPNMIKENVISYIQEFPKEIIGQEYVDYDLQFEKGFLKPIEAILNVIGWSSERVNTLDRFFI
jgi:DNA polymerase elongation subunit (family B)